MKNMIKILSVAVFSAASTTWASPSTTSPSPEPTSAALSDAPGPEAEAAATPASTPLPFSYDHLAGRWGIGLASSPNGGTALDLRQWVSNRTALDFSVGGFDTPNNGFDFNGNEVNYPHWGFGLGLGFKTNLSEPIPGIFLQWLTSLNYSTNETETSLSSVYNSKTYVGFETVDTQQQTLSLFLGSGFEAFLPFFKDLSIEANVGVNLGSNWRQSTTLYNTLVTSNLNQYFADQNFSAALSASTFSILNMAVHYYF